MLTSITVTSVALLATPQEPAPQPAQGTPPQVAWQRTLADALAVQRATGLPLLICVNMDGEVFNDRFASDTYKDAEFVKSTRGYVCVVASPDRHTESDYDALGNRIECPRFGGCTCSEHINIEPELFARFFNGRRNAPRHVGVSPEGKILFDRYLDRTMQTAIEAIADHRGDAKAKHLTATDDLDELFRRRDALARTLLERRYRAGDRRERRRLLERAASATNEPIDLLRMGLRDPDDSLCTLAAVALCKVAGKDALIDIEDALARIDDSGIRAQLLDHLRELGRTVPAAARMASHFESSEDRLAPPWRNTWRDSPLTGRRAAIESELDRVETALRPADKRDDPSLRLQLATAQAAFALHLAQTGSAGVELWLADAERNAGRVGDDALRSERRALQAITAWHQGDPAGARKAAVEAISAVHSDRHPDAWLAGSFLDVLLQVTAQSAYQRLQQDPQASVRGELARTEAIFALLRERGAGSESGLLAGITLFEHVGLRAAARRELQHLVERYPASVAAHERWRNRLLVDLGAERMRHCYAAYAAKAEDRATAQWFAAYAALVAGDQHTRDDRRIEAGNAYGDAIERFTDSKRRNETYADTSDHYTVLALAGRAWIHHLRGDDGAAVRDLVHAHQLRAASFDTDDGLQRKPRAIARRIHDALAASGKAQLADTLTPVLE